jgi:hypothetical protein
MALFSCGASAGLNYLFDILPLGRHKETNDNMFALFRSTSKREKCMFSFLVAYLWEHYTGKDMFGGDVMSSATYMGTNEASRFRKCYFWLH